MNDSCDCPPQGDILGRALVPEHSVGFMCAMSGGRSLCVGDFLFFHSDDWLMGIGYPLALEQLCEQADEALLAPKDLADNALAFEAALTLALDKTGARACWAVAPCMPERLTAHVVNEDLFYILPAQAHIPPMLRRHVEAAAKRLNVTEDRLFSAAHRRLWAEQLARADMRPNVRELYARTESALAASRAQEGQSGTGGPLLDLRLLNALNPDGSLAASLLLDYSPERFCSYIIGAHSKENYCPHATDLLFAELLARCRAQGKRFIHMGLGVNQGIARFKRKWGAQPILPYAMAAWEEAPHARQRGQKTGKSRVDPEIGRAVNALLSAPPDISKQRLFDSFPQQRSFAMIYEVRKKNALSYLCGSAHFFRYSFEFAFRDLFAGLHTVIFEGPLDEDFLAAVERSGRNPAADDPRLARCMTETEIARLERVVYGPEGALARLAGQQRPRKIDVRDLLENARPWFAFFSLWVACLERLGWYESVDLEAWRTAKDMGKAVIAMENLEEQLDSLESVPMERIVDFFRRCDQWQAFSKRNISSYLAGDLERMTGSSIEFPSRTEMVIDRRDERFRQRMRPFLESGDCAVFVGTAHLLGLIPMLRQDGFTVTQAYPSLGLKLKSRLRSLFKKRSQ